MKQKLSFVNRIWIGFTLFSMFFGAGNLIFPPFLGYSAGKSLWRGLAGFLVSAVILPILGVGAVALAGGLEKLTERVHPKFSRIFPLLIYLSIGPFLAIPRTAGTSYEMAVLPLLGKYGGRYLQLTYTLLFFAAAYGISLKPDRLSNWLGKVMTPCLLFLVALIFVGCICWPMGQWADPLFAYRENPAARGFLEGYQTMDTLAALNFGIVIALNIRAKGVTKETFIVRETLLSGFIAGVLLTLIYGALAYIGSLAGTGLPGTENGAGILTWAVEELYGRNGLLILAVIFFISCFNVCTGLLCCCSEYFSIRFPWFPYPGWAALFSLISFGIANIGLTRILDFSVPIIHSIYPVAIVLIILSFIHPWICRFPLIYPCCIFPAALVSVADNLEKLPGWTLTSFSFLKQLPGYSIGFSWLLPAVIGALTGILASCLLPAVTKNKHN